MPWENCYVINICHKLNKVVYCIVIFLTILRFIAFCNMRIRNYMTQVENFFILHGEINCHFPIGKDYFRQHLYSKPVGLFLFNNLIKQPINQTSFRKFKKEQKAMGLAFPINDFVLAQVRYEYLKSFWKCLLFFLNSRYFQELQ